jgi:hypothetical protein
MTSTIPAPLAKRPFGTATREIVCAEAVIYNDRVLTEKSFAELEDKLQVHAAGSSVETLELYTIVKPCRIYYRAGEIRVHREEDPSGGEVFSLIDEQSNALLYFTPTTEA